MKVGQNAPISANAVKLSLQGCPDGVGIFAIPLHSDKTASGSPVTKTGMHNGIAIHPNKDIEMSLGEMSEPRYLVAAISLNGTTLDHQISGRTLALSDLHGGIEQAINVEMTNANAFCIEFAEIYKHNGAWKIRCLLGTYGTEQDFVKRFGFNVNSSQFEMNTQASLPSGGSNQGSIGKSQDTDLNLSMPANTDEVREAAGKLFNAGKGWLNRFASASRNKAEELKTEALKYKSESFLNAVVAGGLLVGWADGSLSRQEADKLKSLICTSSALSVYDEKDIVEVFERLNAEFIRDFDVGELAALDMLRKVKGDSDKADFILQLVISIGASDGNFDNDERRYARKIALALDVEPSRFEL